MLLLSAADRAQLARASQALLSPLGHAHVDGWRAAVNRELRQVIGADSVGFLLPVADAAPVFSEEHAPEVLARFPELVPPALGDGTPIWQRALELGVATLDTAYGRDAGLYYGSAYYNEYARPGGAAQTLSASMPVGEGATPLGAASVQLWRDASTHARFGEREVAMLQLLEPAFRAGVEGWMRFGREGVALMRTIDLLDQAVVACDARGRAVHATGAVERLLRDDPDREVVRTAVGQLAQQLRIARGGAGVEGVASARRELATRCARYVLHCCLEPAGGAQGDPLLLVSLRRETPRRRVAEELRVAFSLTPAEAQVARLIADGKRNAEIAAALGISEHTAKRHTERVMAKVGARSRAEVGARLDS